MSSLLFHIASGHSYFTGITLLLLAVFVSTRQRSKLRPLWLIVAIIGVVAIGVSSTPIPAWCVVILGLVLFALLLCRFKKSWHGWAPWLVAIGCLLLLIVEAPYHLMPEFKPASARSLTVIGDSVTAGVADEQTWPRLLAREHHLQLQDLSHVGYRTSNALEKAKQQPITSPLVIIEIGGNDLLGGTSVRQFERDLDALLSHLSSENRQIVMFELPLPPFFHRYGEVQRGIAWRHGVQLIPKRVFMSVIADEESTVDGIHLSQHGQNRMARKVWSVVNDAYASDGH